MLRILNRATLFFFVAAYFYLKKKKKFCTHSSKPYLTILYVSVTRERVSRRRYLRFMNRERYNSLEFGCQRCRRATRNKTRRLKRKVTFLRIHVENWTRRYCADFNSLCSVCHQVRQIKKDPFLVYSVPALLAWAAFDRLITNHASRWVSKFRRCVNSDRDRVPRGAYVHLESYSRTKGWKTRVPSFWSPYCGARMRCASHTRARASVRREKPRITEAVANGRTVSRLSSAVHDLHARTRRLGPIGTHIGILLPGLRPVIARFSAISHGRSVRGAPPGRRPSSAKIRRACVRAIPCYQSRINRRWIPRGKVTDPIMVRVVISIPINALAKKEDAMSEIENRYDVSEASRF